MPEVFRRVCSRCGGRVRHPRCAGEVLRWQLFEEDVMHAWYDHRLYERRNDHGSMLKHRIGALGGVEFLTVEGLVELVML